jgi:hypothetical protein
MMGLSADSSGPLGLVFSIIVGIVLIAAWVILAGSRFIQGGVVERTERVPQLYGYTVCLIALLWALTSVVSLIDNALTLSAPEMRGRHEFGMEPSITSFEAFRTTYDRARQFSAPNPMEVKLDSIPEAELRRRYEVLRDDQIRRSRFEAKRGLIVGTLSLLMAAALFAFHWRWLKRAVTVTTV